MADEATDEEIPRPQDELVRPFSVNLSKIPPSAERSCLAERHCASQADQYGTATRNSET